MQVSSFDPEKDTNITLCKAVVKNTSTFMINLFSYSHELDKCELCVNTCDEEKQKVELDKVLPDIIHTDSEVQTGEAKTEYFQRFKLKPKTYIFSLNIKLEEELNEKKVNFLMKIGSDSECKFEEYK